MEPLFAPMGWDWRTCAALFFGFIAKEVVVGSLAILYGVGEEGLTKALRAAFTPVSALAFMALTLIYVPCLATVAAIKSELGWKYALLAVAYELVLAYLIALCITIIGGALAL